MIYLYSDSKGNHSPLNEWEEFINLYIW
jgi:hypothetical protein